MPLQTIQMMTRTSVVPLVRPANNLPSHNNITWQACNEEPQLVLMASNGTGAMTISCTMKAKPRPLSQYNKPRCFLTTPHSHQFMKNR
jgi:hypothetical protein